MSAARTHFGYGASGLLLGLALSLIGFSDFGEVNRMFTLQDPRLFLVFGGAVVLCGIAYALFGKASRLPQKTMHAGIVPGGLLFGAGWALTGACPAVAVVQLGEGRMAALLSFGGILAGSWLVGRLRAKPAPKAEVVCG